MLETARTVPAVAIPPHALAEWRLLARVLAESGPAPCETSDAEAWWPHQTQLDGPAVRMAVDACGRCAARDACLAYALAAGERGGVWGGLLPAQRRAARRQAA